MLNKSLEVGSFTLPNRVCFQPMEGCDCELNGAPSELTKEKYIKAARSGAGLIWFEANAVCPEGRTNPRQMMLTEENLDDFKELVGEIRKIAEKECGIRPVLILQLTHSGRQSIKPMILYRHPLYEQRRPVTDENIVSDEYLDTLPGKYAHSAKLAALAGFDGVDVKSCHGYLFQELLSAYVRQGRYGGSLENRMSLLINSIKAVKAAVPENMLLTTRLSVTDMIPHPYGFGTDEDGNIDLSEPRELISRLADEGISMLNVTLGNPYFNPHVNRPYKKGGYEAPEDASVGLHRFEEVEKWVKESFPALKVVGSGVSYYREELMEVAERRISEGVCDVVGFGRVTLAYPAFYRDYEEGKFDSRKCCMACSKCTELMRAGKVSGCAVFNPYYRELYKEIKK